ncbi:MAG: response regulator transcription factor [Patulibacter sp.]
MEHFESSTVLLISADSGRVAFLTDQLSADGYDVVVADGVAMGSRALARCFPDVVIVDARLPDGTAAQLIRTIRDAELTGLRLDPATPALVLVGGDDPFERTRALERGADDAITAPPHYPELVARLRVLVRRSQQRARRGFVRVGPLQVDPATREVRVGDRSIELSQKEFQLLQVLASEPTRVFGKDELLRMVWGFGAGGRSRTLDSHACRLRQKLRVGGARFVVNVWGVGYRLVDGPIEIVAALQSQRPAIARSDLRVAA